MRTKTLLLTAVLGIASAAASMAQAVYSVNVVGYVNLTMRPGFTLVANQLKGSPNNQLGTVLPGVPADSQVQKFAANNYTSYFYDGSGWIDFDGNPTTVTVNPGEGFFFFNPNPGPLTVTTVGEVTTGNGLTVPIPPGFSLISSIVPQDISLTAANGFTLVADMQLQKYTGVGPDFYQFFFYDGTGWIDFDGNPADARLLVGEGGFIFNPDAVNHNWVRNFNPNTP
jgi:hypothetical protein